jgi:hypothetical protein
MHRDKESQSPMRTTWKSLSEPSQSRFLTPPVLASLLALGASVPSVAQTQEPTEPFALSEPFTTFESRPMPVAPWLTPSTPASPDWLDALSPSIPFLRPGLGTSAIGDNLMPAGSGGRPSRTNMTPIPVGPVDLGFDLSYGLTYGNGLPSGPDQQEASLRQTLTPGINIFAGERWSIRYSPSVTLYSADGFKDTIDHLVSLAGSAQGPVWDFGLNHATSISSQPLIETARQTDQTAHSTGLTANRDVGAGNSLSFSLIQSIRFAGGSPDSYSWLNQNWFDRTLTDRVSAGIGLGVGYDILDPGTDMLPLRLSGRFRGTLGTKFSYSLSGGADRREFIDSDADANLSPLVSVTLTYQIVDKVSVFASFDHTTDTSYFSDQFTENSSLLGGLTYLFALKWSASVSGGFRSSSYQSTTLTDMISRKDDSSFANLTIAWRPTRKLTTSLNYSYRANSSDLEGFNFDSHQVGLRISYSL